VDKKTEIKKVLITGVSGLVGSEICKKFLEDNWKVTGVTNHSDSEINHPNYNGIKIDLSSGKLSIDDAFDKIIHCAAVIPGQIKDEQHLFDVNSAIDDSVKNYCKANGSKLIYFSTAYMYESPTDKLTEEGKLRTDLKGYYLAKKKSEEELSSSEIKNIIFRISSPYGNLNKQKNVMKLFADKIKSNEPITLVGKGSRCQNFIHTDDIYRACKQALNNNCSGIFNLTYGKNYTMLELAESIKEIYASKSEIRFDTEKTDIEVNLNFDISKLQSEFGWQPAIDLKSGLTKTLLN
jgi:nucleoside-diphosphate-sugar epimerase